MLAAEAILDGSGYLQQQICLFVVIIMPIFAFVYVDIPRGWFNITWKTIADWFFAIDSRFECSNSRNHVEASAKLCQTVVCTCKHFCKTFVLVCELPRRHNYFLLHYHQLKAIQWPSMPIQIVVGRWFYALAVSCFASIYIVNQNNQNLNIA